MSREQKARISVIVGVVIVLTIIGFVMRDRVISEESMGRPYILTENGKSATIVLDEIDWEYKGKTTYYQYVYKEKGGKWHRTPPKETNKLTLNNVSIGEEYYVKVYGLNKNKRKLGESDTVTLMIGSEELGT